MNISTTKRLGAINTDRKLLLSFSGTMSGLLDHIAATIYLSETIDNCPDSIAFGDSEDCEGCCCEECMPEA